MSDRQTIEQIIHLIGKQKGGIDILINNAGYGGGKRFEDFSVEELEDYMTVNYFGALYATRAAWDIYGKMKGRQLYELWKGDVSKNPICDYTIGIDTIDKMIAKMKEKPWPVYKIKVGTADDIAIVKALRENTDATLRVDANAAWDLETALQLIPQLKELGVELVEQPLAKED